MEIVTVANELQVVCFVGVFGIEFNAMFHMFSGISRCVSDNFSNKYYCSIFPDTVESLC